MIEATNSKSKLTIGIPTYNRSNIIGELLDNIFNQVTEEILPRLEVLISDNASDEDYSSVIKKYATLFPNVITYQRSPSNVGFSANVDNVIRSATGDFVLVMSDDDGLVTGALETVFTIIDSHPDIGLAILSSCTYNQQMTTMTYQPAPSPDKYFLHGMDYIRKVKSFPPALISGYVFRRACWMNNHPEKQLDVNSIHLVMAVIVLSSTSCYVQSSRPLVKYRADMGQWSIETDPLFPFPMFVSYLKGCRAIKSIYPKDIFSRLYCTTLRTVMGFTIRNKVLGYPFPKREIRKLLDPYLDRSCFKNSIYTLVMLILLQIPKWILYVPFRWLVPQKL